ncbi:MAG: response regulator [Rhodospirillales bacterium]|nr:response regulator [Rhodospirillales bacterium]
MGDEIKKILYVEDEPDIQKVAKLALEHVGGFEVMVCGSGPEAIKNGPAFEPDMILLDVMMPGMDGPATLEALRKIDSLVNTPAVFLTAKVLPTEIQRYKELGALDVIAKPFDPMALSDQVRAVWDKR